MRKEPRALKVPSPLSSLKLLLQQKLRGGIKFSARHCYSNQIAKKKKEEEKNPSRSNTDLNRSDARAEIRL